MIHDQKDQAAAPELSRLDAYKQYFSEDQFWGKLAQTALAAGRGVVEKALQLFYTATAKDTPLWAKGLIFGALGYFILPVDAVPDILPVVGFSDDLATLAAAVAAVGSHLKPEYRDMAKETLRRWFEAKSKTDKV